MSAPLCLFLCDHSTVMAQPWLKAGYECWCVDLRHPGREHRDKGLVLVGADIRKWLPPRTEYLFAFAFPPCTHLAVSGARWLAQKGLSGLAEGIELVERCAAICEWTGAPWGLENPVSTLATYWRKPNYYWHPWEYAGWLDDAERENTTKKTCLWTGGGFVMPPKKPAAPPHRNDVWLMGPSEDRGDRRSITPEGFAGAVFAVNAPHLRAVA